jgi:hypothetical protein
LAGNSCLVEKRTTGSVHFSLQITDPFFPAWSGLYSILACLPTFSIKICPSCSRSQKNLTWPVFYSPFQVIDKPPLAPRNTLPQPVLWPTVLGLILSASPPPTWHADGNLLIFPWTGMLFLSLYLLVVSPQFRDLMSCFSGLCFASVLLGPIVSTCLFAQQQHSLMSHYLKVECVLSGCAVFGLVHSRFTLGWHLSSAQGGTGYASRMTSQVCPLRARIAHCGLPSPLFMTL